MKRIFALLMTGVIFAPVSPALAKDALQFGPAPAWVAFSHVRQWAISASSSLVRALSMIDIGQIMRRPTCGPPIPSAAFP